MKKKWEDTDIKGGASALGTSIADSSKRTSAAIKESFKDENV